MNDNTYSALYNSLINDYNKLRITGELKNLTKGDATNFFKKYSHMDSREYTHSIYTVFKQEKEYPISTENIGYKYIPYTATLIDHTEKGFGVYKAVLINKQNGNWVVYNKDTKALQYVKAKVYTTNDKLDSLVYGYGSYSKDAWLLLPSNICDTLIAKELGAESYHLIDFRLVKAEKNEGITEDTLFLSLYQWEYDDSHFEKYFKSNNIESENSTLYTFVRSIYNQYPMYMAKNITTNVFNRITSESMEDLKELELNSTLRKRVFLQVPSISIEDLVKYVTVYYKDLIKDCYTDYYEEGKICRGYTKRGEEFKLIADDSGVYYKSYKKLVDFEFLSKFCKNINPIYEFIVPDYLIVTGLPFEETADIIKVRKLFNALKDYQMNLSLKDIDSNPDAKYLKYDYVFKTCLKELLKTYPDTKEDYLKIPLDFHYPVEGNRIVAINRIENDFEVIIREKSKFKKSTLSEVCNSKLSIFSKPNTDVDSHYNGGLIGYCKENDSNGEHVVLQVTLEDNQYLNIESRDLEFLIGFTLNKKEEAKAKLISNISMSISQDNRLIEVKGIPEGTTEFNIPTGIVGAEINALALPIDKEVGTIVYNVNFAETQKLYLKEFDWTRCNNRREFLKPFINVIIGTKDLKVVNNIITNHVIATPHLFSNVVRHTISVLSNSDYINFNLNPDEKEWNLNFLLTLTTNEVYVLTFMSDINSCLIVRVDPENTSKIYYEDFNPSIELDYTFTESEYRTPCISRFITSQVYDSDTALEYLGYNGVVKFVQTYFNTIDKLAKVPIKLDKLGFTRYTKFLRGTSLRVNTHTMSFFSAQFRRYYATLVKGISLYLLVFRNALSDADVLKFDNNLIRLVNDIRKLKDECLQHIDNNFKNVDFGQKYYMRKLAEIYSIFKLENTVLDTLFTHIILNKGIKLDWSKTNVVDNLVTMANVTELLK